MRKKKTRVHKPRTERQKLRDKADDLWKLAIKRQTIERIGKDACEKCDKDGERYKLDRHHVFGRKAPMRHVIEGGLSLCVICHSGGAHSTNILDQREFYEWAKEYMENFDYLEAMSYHFKKSDYNMEILKLTAYLKEG